MISWVNYLPARCRHMSGLSQRTCSGECTCHPNPSIPPVSRSIYGIVYVFPT